MQDKQTRLEEIFGQAVMRGTPTARAEFLTHVCGDDTQLRQRLEVLLNAHDASGPAFLDLPHLNSPASEGPGTRIGRYKLLEQIGEGGFGAVFMAEQDDSIRRLVALKIIKLGMDTRQVIARFEVERQALAIMDHPNIARVFDAGATETGRPYFVMELVKGIPITKYCDERKLSTKQRLQLFISVCHAVEHAHQKGIIHRDLKPNNVLVTLHDDKPVVKIIDFGVAKATQAKLTDRTLFTGFRQLIGTPAYMSPEQAQMSGMDIDTRSDIYSLGVLLYEFMTSTTPFDSKHLLNAAQDEMRRIIREVDPPPPSTRLNTLAPDTLNMVAQQRENDPKHLAQSIRGDLDWIIMRCLEKDRTRRYATAGALADDVQRYLSDEPVVARQPTRLYRMRKFARRNKVAVMAGGAVVVSLIMGFGVATWMYLQERHSEQVQFQLRQQAETDKERIHIEAVKSRQVAQLLKDMLRGIDPFVAVGRDTSLLREILDHTADRIGDDLKHQPEVAAELLETIGYAYDQIGPLDKAESLEREALAIRRSLPGDHRLDVASSLHYLGLVLWKQDNYAEAEKTLRESLAIRREMLSDASWGLPDTLLALGGVLTWHGETAEAEALEREAVQLRRLQNNDSELAHSLSLLGRTLDQEGKQTESEATLQEAIAVAKKVYRGGHPILAEALRFLGSTLHHSKKLTEAEAVLNEALAIDRKIAENGASVNLAWTLDELAAVLADQGRFPEAEDLLREALPIQRQILGDDHLSTTTTQTSLADLLRRQGKLDEAEKLGRQPTTSSTTASPTTRS